MPLLSRLRRSRCAACHFFASARGNEGGVDRGRGCLVPCDTSQKRTCAAVDTEMLGVACYRGVTWLQRMNASENTAAYQMGFL